MIHADLHNSALGSPNSEAGTRKDRSVIDHLDRGASSDAGPHRPHSSLFFPLEG